MNSDDKRIWDCSQNTKRKRFGAVAVKNGEFTIKYFPTRLAGSLCLSIYPKH